MAQYRRNPEVDAAPMQDETVLYIPSADKFCVLNSTAAHMWSFLDQPRTEDELSAELCRAFDDVDPEVAGRDVRDTLAELTDLEVVSQVE